MIALAMAVLLVVLLVVAAVASLLTAWDYRIRLVEQDRELATYRRASLTLAQQVGDLQQTLALADVPTRPRSRPTPLIARCDSKEPPC